MNRASRSGTAAARIEAVMIRPSVPPCCSPSFDPMKPTAPCEKIVGIGKGCVIRDHESRITSLRLRPVSSLFALSVRGRMSASVPFATPLPPAPSFPSPGEHLQDAPAPRHPKNLYAPLRSDTSLPHPVCRVSNRQTRGYRGSTHYSGSTSRLSESSPALLRGVRR